MSRSVPEHWCRKCGGGLIGDLEHGPTGIIFAPVWDATLGRWRRAPFACDGQAIPWTREDQQTGARLVACLGTRLTRSQCLEPVGPKGVGEKCLDGTCAHRKRPALPSIGRFMSQKDDLGIMVVESVGRRSTYSHLHRVWIELGYERERRGLGLKEGSDRWSRVLAGEPEVDELAGAPSWWLSGRDRTWFPGALAVDIPTAEPREAGQLELVPNRGGTGGLA